jgi:hypothetical protein
MDGIDSSGSGLNAINEIANGASERNTSERPTPPASRKTGTAGLNSRAIIRKQAAQRYFFT